ncbi:hypothetical protein BJF85_19665 [Saccharomonospora sp. CUA-673]|uniref:hypothetical protein n=1 Tax=Saccharomonospora sp. CUA-673 TaxID=1904969 RepID=UPI0009592997|nr:hypothetical protein [Saccharomonospora sp. CUA-673]OLT44697.1 hypothetical protein BJF85_19665 [Saccharomonospora sp. CUA-673]
MFTIMQEAQYLGQQPMLGTGPYAEQVARHVQQSNSGAQGLLPVLDQLLETLRQSDEALRTAMENYRRAEDDQKSTFNT